MADNKTDGQKAAEEKKVVTAPAGEPVAASTKPGDAGARPVTGGGDAANKVTPDPSASHQVPASTPKNEPVNVEAAKAAEKAAADKAAADKAASAVQPAPNQPPLAARGMEGDGDKDEAKRKEEEAKKAEDDKVKAEKARLESAALELAKVAREGALGQSKQRTDFDFRYSFGGFEISGEGFGPDKGTVMIGGFPAQVTRWDDKNIRGRLPDGLRGQVDVVVGGKMVRTILT